MEKTPLTRQTEGTRWMVELRELGEEDLPTFYLWQQQPVAFGTFDEPSHISYERLKIRWRNGDFSSALSTTWMIHVAGSPVGFANCTRRPWEKWIMVMGLVIARPEYRGRGIGTMAHRLVVDRIFTKFSDIDKIEAVTDVENKPEHRALEKSGFSHEGTLRLRNRLRGQYRDMRLYGQLRSEWVHGSAPRG